MNVLSSRETRLEVITRIERELVETKDATDMAIAENAVLLCRTENRLLDLDQLLLVLEGASSSVCTTSHHTSDDHSVASSSISSRHTPSSSIMTISPCHTFAASEGDTEEDFDDTTAAVPSRDEYDNSSSHDSIMSWLKPLRHVVSESSLSDNKRDLMKHIAARQENKIRSILGGLKESMKQEERERMTLGEI